MRVWVDLTKSQTLELCERFGIDHTAIGRHRGGQLVSKGVGLVISAGGAMNREAVALGMPVYTTFEGRVGAVDEALLHEGRPRRLADAADVTLERRPEHVGLRVRRDPRELVKLLLSAADS